MKVTASTLRTIDKVGGLDEYLLKSSLDPVLGQYGQQLKQRVLDAKAVNASQAVMDGLPPNSADLFKNLRKS